MPGHMQTTTFRTSSMFNRILVPLAAGIVTLAVLWRFWPWMHDYLYGDDLAYLLSFHAGSCATTPSEILTAVCQDRFRPVASAFVILLMNTFDASMPYYTASNVAIQVLIGTLAFAVAHRLSGGRWVVSLAVAIMVATSRFALFHVTQAIGPVESLTLLFTLGVLYCIVRADESPERAWGWAWGALALTFLAIHTHERFIVLAAWLFTAFISSPSTRSLGRGRLLALLAAAVALPVFYISYKTFALETHFMVGTGGTHIDFDFSRIFEHALQALLSVFGFNHGPDYLVGTNIDIGMNKMTLLAGALTASWLGLFAWSVWTTSRAGPRQFFAVAERLRWLLLLLGLAAFLLAPTLLTVRLEQRWLLAPFSIVALVAAWSAGRIYVRHSKAVIALVVTMLVASLTLDTRVMRYYDRVYLVYSARFAALVKHDIIDKSPAAVGPLAFIADETHCSWTLINGGFFGIYGASQRPVRCFGSMDAAIDANLDPEIAVYAENGESGLLDVRNEMQASRDRETSTVVDLVENFPHGQISSRAKVDTPTGLGAMQMPWDSVTGSQSTLTVISGFSYRYDDVAIPAEAKLDLAVSMIYPASQSARLIISLTPKDGQPRELLSKDLVPPLPGAKLRFAPQRIPLDAFAGQRVSIAFGVESPGGDSSGHWVGMASPRIVVDAAAQP